MSAGSPPLPPQRPTARLHFGAFRYSAVELLLVLVLLFVSAPLVVDLPHGDLIEVVLLTVVMVSAVLAVGGSRRSLLVALLLGSPALLAKWVYQLRPDLISPMVHIIATMVFFLFVVGHLLFFILRAGRVDANVLCAGLSGYLLLGLLWAPAYLLIASVDPGSFALKAASGTDAQMDGFHAFYFSFITLCTVGYGDVTPVSRMARMLAVTEAITGIFYVAVLISRLVAVYSAAQRHDGGGPPVPDRKPPDPAPKS